VYSEFVEIPPGSVVELVFELDGVVGSPDEVVTWRQPPAFEVSPTSG
jgi:hypothetical protein